MAEIQKENYKKPLVSRVVDLGIMLECLYEVYESEESLLWSGKPLRTTMAYPFIKMIESQCRGLSVKEIHRLLWSNYLVEKEKSAFIKTSKDQLVDYGKGAGV